MGHISAKKARCVGQTPDFFCGLQTCHRPESAMTVAYSPLWQPPNFPFADASLPEAEAMAFRANDAVPGCTRPGSWSRISVTSGGMGRTYGRAFSQGFPERNGRRQQNAPNTHTWHAVGRAIADDEPSAASFMKEPLAGGNVKTFAAGSRQLAYRHLDPGQVRFECGLDAWDIE